MESRGVKQRGIAYPLARRRSLNVLTRVGSRGFPHLRTKRSSRWSDAGRAHAGSRTRVHEVESHDGLTRGE
ncbi:hypothetical protein F2Q69_00048000 [Brassica cretica]|uniref:Uncharacterized protein n=1 Tax=Brassica cretica TaxID=69181 RepID=A0A8S9PXL6_BRACR|nr:hypothetical protein F2Q69_00048000 [Brassica cretica]